jgi:glycolate oxidase
LPQGTNTIKGSLRKQIRDIVGPENFLDSAEAVLVYGYDATPLVGGKPDAIVLPRSTEEVAAVLRLANLDGFPVIPRGAGSGLSGGSVPIAGGLVMTWGRMCRILEVDTTNLVAIVEPGVTTASLHREVEKRKLYYPPDPGSMTTSTLGGNVGENAGGPHCLKYGVTGDYVLGLEAVLPSGEVLPMGSKAVKNVAGYDLCGIIVGSEGTLAVVTRIWARLVPKPETKSTALLHFRDAVRAAEAVQPILQEGIVPSALEILDNTTIRCVEDYAHIGLPLDADAILLVEVDGAGESVRRESAALERISRASGAYDFRLAADEREADELFAARRSALAALSRVSPTTMLEDVTVPRSEVGNLVKKIQDIARAHTIRIGTFGHLGDGNLHPTLLTDERDKDEIARAVAARGDIFAAALAMGGTISGEHGTGVAKRAYLGKQFAPAVIETMRKVKAAFDPRNILNPQKIFQPPGEDSR